MILVNVNICIARKKVFLLKTNFLVILLGIFIAAILIFLIFLKSLTVFFD